MTEAEKFCLEGDIVSVEPYGDGHIGGTRLVKTAKDDCILRKIIVLFSIT